MVNLFEVRDKTGRKIRLTYKQWKHIAGAHPTLRFEEIEITLTEPLIINPSKYNNNVRWYYKFNKIRKRYLMISVKYLNGEGFIVTAHYLKNIK